MRWGVELTGTAVRVCLISASALALAGCQPSLKSDLPVGVAAYSTIGDAEAMEPIAAYYLRPGDKIAVNIFQEEDLSQREIQIDEAGTISLPLLGDVQAAGRSSGQLSREIERAYGTRFLRDPQVNVVLLSARPRTISVEGQVRTAGVYPIEPGQTLLTAMALAGSPAIDAKLDEVLVFRTVNGERMGGRFDITDIRAGRMPDPQILPGDVIVVGFSALRGLYRDILQAAPLFGAFVNLSRAANNN